ncbi:MAG TPA: hypothetical protein VKV33_11965 [Streptosporangiaceae bacterium]|nr:hypothetical protein [Streptosporangiaceae bacterium]
MYGPLLALVAVLVALHRWWGAELVLFPLLLILPGVLVLRALRVPGAVVASFPVYVPAASLGVLILSSLAVDALAPLVGVGQPLRTVPLLIGVELACGVLLAVSLRAPESTAIPWRGLDWRPRQWWPLLIPLVAGAGALRLNGGHGNAVALLAACACVVAVVWGIVLAPRLGNASLMILLYAVSLAVMWAYSLRGDVVYGFDISTEYYALHHTVVAGVWHFSHPGDAYGALPAVTLVPAELHFLSGVSDLMVLKLLYPAVTALFPVAIFGLGLRIVERRWAFVAASFIIVQSTFGQELPAVARQEIAMVFFIAMLGAVFDTGLARNSRWTLSAVFGAGMVLGHYSTTYFAIGMLVMLVVLQWVVSWFRDIPRVMGAFVVALLVTTAGAVIWYGPVTRSAANVSQFISLTTSHGLNLLPSQASGQNLISSYLSGNTDSAMSASQYQQQVAQEYASQKKFVTPLPDAGAPKYALRNSAAPEPPVHLRPVQSLLGLIETVAGQLAELLGAIGAIILALRRKTPAVARQLALLSAGTLLALGAIRLSGTIASAYNQQRAFVQAFAILGITMSWTLQGLAGRSRRRHWLVTTAAAAALAIIFIQMSGLTGAILGGGTATNLANSGEDEERYDTTAPEIASAQWLGQHFRPGQLVYADRYGELRLNAETPISRGLLNDITPQTLDRGAWVYASRANIVDGRARQLFDNHTVTYVFPLSFLDANFNVVYANGSSEVFRG